MPNPNYVIYERDVDLLSYLPEYLKQYREMREIMETENPEFKIVVREAGAILNNLFILSCDEVGVEKFEELLGITPGSSDTLETRILRCLMRWNEGVPYTWNALLQKLDALCEGKDNYELVRDPGKRALYVTIHVGKEALKSEIEHLLEYFKPANMTMEVFVRYNIHDYFTFVNHSDLHRYTHDQLRTEEVFHRKYNTHLYVGQFRQDELTEYTHEQIRTYDLEHKQVYTTEYLMKKYRHMDLTGMAHDNLFKAP